MYEHTRYIKEDGLQGQSMDFFWMNLLSCEVERDQKVNL